MSNFAVVEHRKRGHTSSAGSAQPVQRSPTQPSLTAVAASHNTVNPPSVLPRHLKPGPAPTSPRPISVVNIGAAAWHCRGCRSLHLQSRHGMEPLKTARQWSLEPRWLVVWHLCFTAKVSQLPHICIQGPIFPPYAAEFRTYCLLVQIPHVLSCKWQGTMSQSILQSRLSHDMTALYEISGLDARCLKNSQQISPTKGYLQNNVSN